MIDLPEERISLPNCLLNDKFLQESGEDSNELEFYRRTKSNDQFLKPDKLSVSRLLEEDDNFWLYLVKGILLMLVLYSLCVVVYRFVRILQRFKQYQQVGKLEIVNENATVDETVERTSLSRPNNDRTHRASVKMAYDENNNEHNQKQMTKSRSSRSKRISPSIERLSRSDLKQVKLITIVILAITFVILLLETFVLSQSNNLILISMLTLFSLISMLGNFKNDFDQLGQINLIIFIIDFTFIKCIDAVNRLNLYKSRKRRRYSFETSSPDQKSVL